jgi:hypothetical protein
MDIQIIGLWVGLAITFLLGLINFLWGGAILARREKVAIVNPEVDAGFLNKGTRQTTYAGILTLSEHIVSIEARCELLLTSGEKEEVKEVEVILNEKACKSLRRYFHIPLRNRFQLTHINAYEGKPLPQPVVLELKKTVQFRREIPLNCTDTFKTEYGKMESGSYPEFIQPFLDRLETEYQICWTRYDGKRLCWNFPNKWWRNLGKKLWG